MVWLIGVIAVILALQILQGSMVLYLLRHYGSELKLKKSREVVGLPINSPVPDFVLSDPNGISVSSQILLSEGLPVALAFSDPGCRHCTELIPDLAQWQQAHADALNLIVVTAGSAEVIQNYADSSGFTRILGRSDGQIMERLKLPGTPSVVIIHPNGTMGRSAIGASPIRVLISEHIQSINRESRGTSDRLQSATV